jgi:hypothetical protein
MPVHRRDSPSAPTTAESVPTPDVAVHDLDDGVMQLVAPTSTKPGTSHPTRAYRSWPADSTASRYAPIPVGSIADIVFVANRPTSAQEANDPFRQDTVSSRYEGILGVSEDPPISLAIRVPRSSNST